MKNRIKVITWDSAIGSINSFVVKGKIAQNTARVYNYKIQSFQDFIKKPLTNVTMNDVDMFLNEAVINQGIIGQHQSFNAIKFVFSNILKRPFGLKESFDLKKRTTKLPTVLTKDEIRKVFLLLQEPYSLIAELLYGCGLKLTECIEIRLINIDLINNKIKILNEKGFVKEVPVPKKCVPALEKQMIIALKTFDVDSRRRFYGSFMSPRFIVNNNADPFMESWQYLFPSVIIKSSDRKRRHLDPSHVQKALQKASKDSIIGKKASSNVLRHSCCYHLIEAGFDISAIQLMMGHSDRKTTELYKKLLPPKKNDVLISPLDSF